MLELKNIMQDKVIYVKADTPIYDAIETLVEHNITGLPVVNDDMTIAGIISEKDVLSLISDIKDNSATVADFMKTDVIAFDEQDDVIAVCECLLNNPFRRVPITANEKLVGVISRKDLIKYIIEPIG